MSTYSMSALTAEEIRSIADKAVADVTRQKITTTKATRSSRAGYSKVSGKHMRTVSAKGKAAKAVANSSSNPNAKGMQKSLAGSVLSQSAGRGFFKDAFNKARKG